MLSRALVVGGGVSGVMLVSTVYAAETHTLKGRKLKPCQLPIYEEESAVQLQYIPEEISAFRKHVSDVRSLVWQYTEKYEDTIGRLSDKYEIGKQHAGNLKTYVQEDSGIMQRATIIMLAGFGGIVLGHRGGFLRKTAFATTGMATAAAFCYPNVAIDLTKLCWEETKSYTQELWKSQKAGKEDKANTNVTKHDEKLTSAVEESKLDYGQSNPEDKDMYTTRGS